MLELARDPPTGRHKALEGWMVLVGALEHAGGGMGDIVKTRTAQAVVLQQGGRFMQIATPVFEIGSGATHLGDEPFEQLGNRFPRPGIGHSHAKTVDMAQSRGTRHQLVMMGIQGQHGEHLARAQADADIDHPDQAIGKGGLLQGQAPHGPGRVDADDGESDHPIDDGLRAGCFLDTQSPSEQSQDARDGAKADAGLQKELQGQVNYVDLGSGGESVELRLERMHAGLGRLEGVGEPIALGLHPSLLSSLVALPLAALLGLLFPLIPAVSHFGKLAHDTSLRGHADGPRPWREVQMGAKLSPEHKLIRDRVHRCADQRADRISPPRQKGNS